MATSTVEFESKSYEFKGRAMTHAVISTVEGRKTLVEFAGSIAKAEKVAHGHISRAATVKAGGELRGWVYDPKWYAAHIETIIMPTSVS